MPPEPEVIIVGSGPAGVSAAFPLVQAGIRVLMLDAGTPHEPAGQQFSGSLQELRQSPDQWKTIVGEKFEWFSSQIRLLSPKFRSPAYSTVFRDYRERYAIETDNFAVVGSLARGGLSNVWSAAVSMFNGQDLEDYPISIHDLQPSYRKISKRIGVSGTNGDDMSETHGHDTFLMPPLDLSDSLKVLYRRYAANRSDVLTKGVKIGRTRNAVLTTAQDDRLGCVYCGRCLWGCAQQSIWSAAYDVELLKTYPSFSYRGGFFVRRLVRREAGQDLVADSLDTNQTVRFSAKKVILACGAIGSAKLVLDALGWHGSVPLQCHPIAVCVFLLPRWRWAQLADNRIYAMSQLAFRVDDAGLEGGYASGHITPADALPASIFISQMPFSYPQSRKLIRLMQPSMLLGVCWLSSRYSRHTLRVRTKDGALRLQGGYDQAVAESTARIRKRIRAVMRRYRAFLLPGSFRLMPSGTDVHYAGTVPMRASPRPYEADPKGEIAGLPGVYIVDGAALISIPAKPPTLTIMANADRIASLLAERLLAERGTASSSGRPCR